MLVFKTLVLSTCISLALGAISTTPSYANMSIPTTENPATTTTESSTTPEPELKPGYIITLKSVKDLLDKYLNESQTQYWSREERIQKIVDFLELETSKARKPVLEAMAKLGLYKDVSKFWLVNAIRVPEIPPYLIQKVKEIPGVIDVSKEEILGVDNTLSQSSSILAETVQPNIAKVGADQIWGDTTGKDILVGIIDTGVNANHECLRDNYAGNHGNNLAWYDAFSIVPPSPTPRDDGGHGTHCTGTAVGKCGIGAAKDAQFIACRFMAKIGGLEMDLYWCLQFMACPRSRNDLMSTKLPGAKCGQVPHVVSNSWTANPSYKKINEVKSIWDDMDILGVFAVGNQNTQNACGTAKSPANQKEYFSVGATDFSDKVTAFSGRGPGVEGAQCPSLVAPGKDIISASHKSNTELTPLSGTSQATPLVSGGIALLMSYAKANGMCSKSKYMQELVRLHGTNTNVAFDGTNCENREGVPNFVYGYGRLDLVKAFNALPNWKTIQPCQS